VLVNEALVRTVLGVKVEKLLVTQVAHIFIVDLSIGLLLRLVVPINAADGDDYKVQWGQRCQQEATIESLWISGVELLQAEEAGSPDGS
jgi:hypothetical protein